MAIQVQTTQNVTLNLREAGLGPRLLAYLLDWVFILIWAIGWLIFSPSFTSYNANLSIITLIMWIPVILHDLLFEWLNNGQTPGKKILKIRVVNMDGTTPSFGTYLIRWLFRLVDITLTSGALAILMIAFSDKSQRLGDYLAGTTVISLKPETNSSTLNIPDLDFHSEYIVTYPDLLEKLTDKDANTIRSVLNDLRYYDDADTQKYLADKVKEATGYVYDGSDRAFLKKILDDYNYLSIQ